jgi:transcriptional regulator with XRE-family HTH domain
VSKTLDKKYQKDFGKNLRKFRLAKKLSQHQLALDAGLDKNVVGNIERGESNPQITTVKSLAKVLEVHPKELLDF